MDYTLRECNTPIFRNFWEVREQIAKNGGKEWKSREEIEKEHAKYNTKGKADVVGWISEDLARELVGISHFLYIVTLGSRYVYILPDGYTIREPGNFCIAREIEKMQGFAMFKIFENILKF